jgi:hypothetical protein
MTGGGVEDIAKTDVMFIVGGGSGIGFTTRCREKSQRSVGRNTWTTR